jgi:uncharacterized protein with FMN-binding domain
VRRIVLWLAGTVSALVLLLGYHTSLSSSMATATTGQTPYTSASGSTSGGSGSQAGGAAGSGGNGNGGNGGGGGNGSSNANGGSSTTKTATRTVTGQVVQTQWGPVQVQLTLKGSTITAVSVLQYPSGNPQDTQINGYALPILIKETTDRQSAQIDMVSGATYTSTGYIQSLQSALDHA